MYFRFLSFIALFIMVAGCYFSPWEDLAYAACEGTPACHADAKRYIRTHARKNRHLGAWGGYVIGDTIVSVMIRSSGFSGSYKGPYKVWIQASKRGIGAVPVIIKSLRVRRKGEKRPLFNREDITLEMDKVELEPSPLMYDECMFLLPDMLNPKDGKGIVVEISAVQREGDTQAVVEERDLVYEFSPKVIRGWIRCVD